MAGSLFNFDKGWRFDGGGAGLSRVAAEDAEMLTRIPSLDYLFQIAVEMKKLGIPWESDIEPTLPRNSLKGQ